MGILPSSDAFQKSILYARRAPRTLASSGFSLTCSCLHQNESKPFSKEKTSPARGEDTRRFSAEVGWFHSVCSLAVLACSLPPLSPLLIKASGSSFKWWWWGGLDPTFRRHRRAMIATSRLELRQARDPRTHPDRGL